MWKLSLNSLFLLEHKLLLFKLSKKEDMMKKSNEKMHQLLRILAQFRLQFYETLQEDLDKISHSKFLEN